MTVRRASEFWVAVSGAPGVTARAAARAERDGWDGITVPDSQNLTGDPYIALALAAAATSTLLVGTGVTNPITRHPAVTATSIATLQEESRGRAVLGIGRGDSSLAYLGMAPAPMASFEQYVTRVQGYLRKEEVPFLFAVDSGSVVASARTLELRDTPTVSQLRWLRHGTASKVPVEIVASGPRMIAVGAVLGDRLTLAVGAEPARISWGIEIARTARIEQGLDPDGLIVGAMIPVTCGTDRALARSQMAGVVSGFVRFAVMHGQINGPVSKEVGDALRVLHRSYDMNQHARWEAV